MQNGKRLTLAIFAVSLLLPPQAVHAVATTQSIAIPAYEYPTLTDLWPSIDAAGSDDIPFVIVNPASGPGNSANSDYTTRLNANEAAGIRSIGYVDTNYQSRPIADVIDDVDAWYSLYPDVSGIFFDRVDTGSAADLCYSAYIYNYTKVKHPGSLVIHNFGTYAAPAYEPYGDIFVTAEMDYTLYQTWSAPTDGFHNVGANSNRFWHLIHTTDASDFSDALTATRANNAGWVYITDDVMFNPYDAAPTYFNTELTEVGNLSSSTIPDRGVTSLPAGCLDTTLNRTDDESAGETTSTFTIVNDDDLDAPAPNTLELSLPAGVSLNFANGNNWQCTGLICEYETVAANSSSDDLALNFLADCSYTSGSVQATFTRFPNDEEVSSIPISAPDGCVIPEDPTDDNEGTTPSDDELADTGVSASSTLSAALALFTAGSIVLIAQRKYSRR